MFGSLGPSSSFPTGEYNAYLTAINNSGVEGPVSSTAKNIVSKVSILSPINLQSSLTPQFKWSVPSAWPGGLFWPQVNDSSAYIWSKAVSSGAGTTEGSTTYDGPALSTSKTYYVNIWAEGNDSSGTRYFSMGDSNPSFTVSLTPTPTPTPTAGLTIRGRMVNAIANQPVTSTNMLIWNWKGSVRRDFYLKSDGTFEIKLTEDDITNASITYVNNVHINIQACYDQSQFSIQKTSTGSVDYVRVQGPGGNYSGISTRTIQPINNVADIGDFLVWPVTGFSLVSDIPVKFTSKFANGSEGGGSSNYTTTHGFSTLYPINTSTSIILTNQSGNQYTSSYVKYPLSQHCSQVTLNFANSQFSWSPPGETIAVNSNSSFVSTTFTRDLYKGLSGNDVKQLQALLTNEVGYSAGLVTGYFGRITRDAVKRLQEKYGVRPVSGYFGAITRKALNALISN